MKRWNEAQRWRLSLCMNLLIARQLHTKDHGLKHRLKIWMPRMVFLIYLLASLASPFLS